LRFALAEETLSSESFDHGEAETKSFAGTGQVTDNEVLHVLDTFVSHVLHGEKSSNSALNQVLLGLVRNLREVHEIAGADFRVRCLDGNNDSLLFGGRIAFADVTASVMSCGGYCGAY